MKLKLSAIVLFVATGILLQTSCYPKGDSSFSQTPKISENWDKIVAKEVLTISELKKKHPLKGIYEIEGFLVDTYKCNCPPDIDCDCDAPSVTISERNQASEKREIVRSQLKIWINPDGFTVGRKYRFKIRIPDSYSPDIGVVDYVAHKVSESGRGTAEDEKLKFMTVKEIRETRPKPGFYETNGFVSEIYECPPCPPLMGCEPCRLNNTIRVSEDNTKDSSRGRYELNEKEIFLFTETPNALKVGEKYRFKIKVSAEKLTNFSGLDLIKLVSSKKLKN